MDFENLTKESLPVEFQDRIDRFNGFFLTETGKSFEEDSLFEYEMGCIKQALSFNEYFKDYSESEFTEFTRKYKGKSVFDLIDDIKDKLPYFDNGHSGNSLGASWQLFICYRTKPELIPYMHGCLAGLVGDEGYHDDRSDLWKVDC